MIRRRCHDQRYRDCEQRDGQQMKLFGGSKFLGEAWAKNRYELKSEERLDARKYHAAFLEQVLSRP